MNSASLSLNRFRSWSWFEPGAILLTIVLVLLAFLVLSPIYLLLVSSLQNNGGDGGAYSFASWMAAFNEPGILKACLNTLMVTGLVQGISIPIAIMIAWVIARTDMPGAQFAEVLFWITFFIPTLAVTSGWILVWDPNFGLANQFLTGIGLFNHAAANIYS